jgi:hypothetical protein
LSSIHKKRTEVKGNYQHEYPKESRNGNRRNKPPVQAGLDAKRLPNPVPLSATGKGKGGIKKSTPRDGGGDGGTNTMDNGTDGYALPTTDGQERYLEELFKREYQWFTFEEIDPLHIETRGEIWKQIGNGREACVFQDGKDLEKVYKVVDPYFTCESPFMYLRERLKGHNELFPELSYELEGGGMTADGFVFVVSQLFAAHNGPTVTREEVKHDLEKRGFQDFGDVFVNGEWTVEDMHAGNIFRAKDGTLLYIDLQVFKMTEEDKEYYA